MHEKLTSLQLEKQSLSFLLKFSNQYAEVANFITEDCYTNETHQVIFALARPLLEKSEKIDKIILAQKIKNLNIKTKDDIDIFDYIKILFATQITQEAGIQACKELNKLRICRELFGTSQKAQKFVLDNINESLEAIVAGVDNINNEKINTYDFEDEPVDLYEGIIEQIEERAKNPVEDTGLITPYKDFNRMFGGLRSRNGLYCIVSRPGAGKSSWLLNLANGCTSILSNNCKCVILDTEMSRDVGQYRAASAVSQIGMWEIETGQWVKNKLLIPKMRSSYSELESRKGKIYHLKVTNKNIDQVCSIIKHWTHKYCSNGEVPLVIYDYIKLTGEKLSNHWAEHQAIGEKINKLNEVGEQTGAVIFVAMQMNRSGESNTDDASAVALSDRLQWFAAFNAIFRRKSLEEVNMYGREFGSHILKPLKTRFQGKEATGHSSYINVSFDKKKPKYVDNFINYHVENFKITEHGTLEDIVKKMSEKVNIDDGKLADDVTV